MKNTKIKNLGIKIGVPIGIIAIAGAGTIGYFIGENTRSQPSNYFNYKNSITLSINSGKTNLIENPIGVSSQESNKFFLSDDGLKKLQDKIQNDMQYGPELSDIVQISLDDQNIVNEEATLGAYVPSMDVININTKTWRDEGLSSVSKDSHDDPNIDTKIKLIFQVLFHEYGHFLADEYINSEPKTSLVDKIYSFQAADENEVSPKISGNWNKTFYPEFKKLLNYENQPSNQNNMKSDISSAFTSGDLFNEVNSEDKTKLKNDDPRVNNSYKYYFSIDELLTRKYQLIMMPLDEPPKQGEEGYGIKTAYGIGISNLMWETSSKQQLSTPYNTDFVMINNNYSSPILKEDNPFVVSSELYKLLGEQIGFTDENNLSHISIKDGKLTLGGYTNSKEIKLLVDGKEITNKNYKLDLHSVQPKLNETAKWVDEKQKERWAIESGNISLNNNHSKKDINSASNFFWVTNPINVSEILNKPLSLLINGKTTPLNIRNSSEATISTYRSHQKNKKDYHVVNEKGIIKIVSGSGA